MGDNRKRRLILLLDELGYLPIDKRGADLLFQVVAARYEVGLIVITTNRPLCSVIRAAGSLKSGLALTPGSDPESASSSLRGLRLGGLVILFIARGGPWPGIGGGPVHHAGLSKRKRLADPSPPSFATPNSWLDLTPRFSQRGRAPTTSYPVQPPTALPSW
jgi:IstB-like ATP binding protein